MKRIITLQDITCVGKCALTVALPVISSFGIEACPLPTALLSTHTAFKSFKIFDLHNNMQEIIPELKNQGFSFDGIYSAYLGSKEQIQTVCDFIDDFKTDNTLVLVDPVMGDNGKLYSGFDIEFPKEMQKLCKKADIIVPNVTEASFLLNKGGKLFYSNLDGLMLQMQRLCDLGPKICVLTGVELNKKVGSAIYDKTTGEFYCYLKEKIDRTFHGTGDLFASVLFSALIKGFSNKKALQIAVEFTYRAMKATVENKDASWYGVDFETVLPQLISLSTEIT
ncbi:MAG: pyridoxamine kinase [Clostridiales bacterium]|nr:pyridoxamine kinase [Clostridiales bacterium]